MHILTGLLLARLLKRRAAHGRNPHAATKPSPLCDMPGVIGLVHSLPGRSRFRLPVLKGRPEPASELASRLGGLQGVRKATACARTGSVLLEYDATRLTPELLAAAMVRLLGLERAFAGQVDSTVRREIRHVARACNLAVYQQTGGLLDLRTAVLLGLALVGIKRLMAQRSLALPAGFTLLWWAGHGLLRDEGDGA